MKARIDENGNLEIERARAWKMQPCPWAPNDVTLCGDWCPLFNEGTHSETGKDLPTVLLTCSGMGPWYWITADARPKAGGA